MKKTFYSIIFSLVFLLGSINYLQAQPVVDSFDENEGQNLPDLIVEKVQRISNSKRIFIITNENDGYNAGDFITIVTEGQLTARAIVAKVANKRSGIKIIKIYSLNRWNKLRAGQDVQIIRGDDSFFGRDKKKKEEDETDGLKIASEEDLFNETLLEDDLSLDDKSKRAIKTDNIVGAYVGKLSGVDNDGNSTSYTHLNASWAYQIDDNIWGEILAGRNTVNDFPGPNIDTTINNFIVRAKYTITAPFDSYVKPYIGFQIVNADSPDAGTPGDNRTEEQLNAELDRIDQTEESGVVFGATILKRLVPGWFIRADVGSDIINIGFSLEF